MVSTRHTQSFVPCDLGDPDRRARVDPGKLLALIERIRGATPEHQARTPQPTPKPKPLANAG